MNDVSQTAQLSWTRVAVTVTAIIVIGYFSLGPSVGSHRAPMMQQNLNNLHQIGIAFANYATMNDGRLPDPRVGETNQSWRLMLCKELDRSDIARAYHKDITWDARANRDYTSQWIPVMTSPYRPKPRTDTQGRGYADYGLISGPKTANPPEGPLSFDQISAADGLGQTLLVGECSGLQLIWTEPRDPDVSREEIGIAQVTSRKPKSNRLLSSYNKGSVAVLFADGAAKPLNHSVDAKVLAAIITATGEDKLKSTDGCR